jgi:hypothetical protein
MVPRHWNLFRSVSFDRAHFIFGPATRERLRPALSLSLSLSLPFFGPCAQLGSSLHNLEQHARMLLPIRT